MEEPTSLSEVRKALRPRSGAVLSCDAQGCSPADFARALRALLSRVAETSQGIAPIESGERGHWESLLKETTLTQHRTEAWNEVLAVIRRGGYAFEIERALWSLGEATVPVQELADAAAANPHYLPALIAAG